MEHTYEIQGSISQPLGAGGGISNDTVLDVLDILADESIKLLNKNVFDSEIAKTIVSLGGSQLKSLYRDAHKNELNWNNTFKRLTVAVTALIPHGGAFVSSLIGVIWPDDVIDNNNQTTNIMDQFSDLMNEKIENYDRQNIKATLKALHHELKALDDSLNGKRVSESYYGSDSPDEHNRSRVRFIHSNFKALILQCSKEGYEEPELPLYTAVATAHILFLRCIEKHGLGPKLQFHISNYNEFMKDLKEYPDKYIKHIKETYPKGSSKLSKEPTLVPKYYDETKGNKAFWMAVKRNTLVPQNGKWYYLDRDGKMKTGWVKTGGFIMDDNGQLEIHQPDAYYYFSSNGPMVTGWFTDADGRTYYLSPEETQKFHKGQMVEGFVEIGEGKWFYFNSFDISRLAPNGYDNLPEAGKRLLKDTFGITKNVLRGEQRTEWIHDNGAWYYCSPEKNNRFDKGQMVTGEVNIKNSEGNIKTYHFNNDGACTNP
ncbi:insecticidal delta-endotoxin Cry8Ea1 family protein [Bacillus cereus]|uniref:insecticidal delta-endotoxin Cry8Ea1 family protein n=1 Tax=Bacillus cereus group sp. MYBK34-1 TaxID=3450631 RepID=UPI003F799AE5|nr:insecticidal delta-endotoxin Cry8Ea1 family protein [Bacillus cereus]